LYKWTFCNVRFCFSKCKVPPLWWKESYFLRYPWITLFKISCECFTCRVTPQGWGIPEITSAQIARLKVRGLLFWECPNPRALHSGKHNTFVLYYYFLPWYPLGTHLVLTGYHGKRLKKKYHRHSKKWNLACEHFAFLLTLDDTLCHITGPPFALPQNTEWFTMFKQNS
jgi:hypothetical protein